MAGICRREPLPKKGRACNKGQIIAPALRTVDALRLRRPAAVREAIVARLPGLFPQRKGLGAGLFPLFTDGGPVVQGGRSFSTGCLRLRLVLSVPFAGLSLALWGAVSAFLWGCQSLLRACQSLLRACQSILRACQ